MALGVAMKAWDEAMDMHGMFPKTISECLRHVRMEVEEIVDDHITLVQQRQAGHASCRKGERGKPHRQGSKVPGHTPPRLTTWRRDCRAGSRPPTQPGPRPGSVNEPGRRRPVGGSAVGARVLL